MNVDPSGGEPLPTHPNAPPALPAGFLFSQSALQDDADCRRRFLLRHVRRLNWPAVETEPVIEAEATMHRGSRFHQLAQAAFSGVPAQRLEAQIQDPELLAWWENFAAFSAGLLELPLALPEIGLSAPFGDFRLMARFDLLTASGDGRFTIYDWKTARKRPRRPAMAERLQTRIYPYLLTVAGAALNGGDPIAPEAIEMVYWYASFPDQPERFSYSRARFTEDKEKLADRRREIERRVDNLPAHFLPAPGAPPALTPELLDALEPDFPRTAQVKRCAYCVYRSLCDRGEAAGDLADAFPDAGEPADQAVNIDLEQIVEIAF